ncbi:hypothetical protein A3C59_01205 [Candidatus Daviesbacteria bacterium RIFCSPHIGHO2_02_FULL_36_13]|uniref:Membrane protein 6-pyruvoyl-tetrahydropterin synthase-related domain-containing protein n=1 Tax=Candidatus Daviesbacteria bacterium RIFCSPHIGHO2_02_FULL_36_13 TaxID=1797768 RepID=A0A1F5JW14_9BACT|nr:MAG: hypothetical protein A3C59_01205 [Candidatus Daviesbacteria bacterium RIFCSPHIGHO2_02_FULL_36_13]
MGKFIFLLTIPLFLSLIRPGFFPMQDDLQAFRIFEMGKCFSDFQFPCRWIPDMGYQYGYPQFNFYPPSIYYLGAFLHLIGIQVIDTVKILFILGFLLSSGTMYLLLKELFGKYPAVIGAVLYSIVPYKATEVYVRGSLSEFFSFVFFPLIFWAGLKIVNEGKWKYVGFLALSIGLLLTTHNLMSFIFLPIFGIWALSLVILNKKIKRFPKIILGSILGLGLAAFFTLPVIFENQYVHIETLTGGYFDWRQHFVTFNQLFFSNNFGYGSSFLGPVDDLSLSVGIIHWILGLTALIFALVNFKKEKKLSSLILILGAVTLFVIFLMHQRSTFLWEIIPGFKLLQFPWRFLSDSTFLLSILGAYSIYIICKIKEKWGKGVGVGVIAGLFILHGLFFQPREWIDISDQEKFSGESWEKQLTISIFDYLPIYAKLPPNKKAPELPDTLDGEVEFLSYKKGSNFQVGEVEVKEAATLRLPLFDFPGMEVKVDGQKIVHWHDDCRGQEYCLGLITFSVLQGKHTIEAKLKDTQIRQTGNMISLVSVFLVGSLFYLSKKYDKND